ncbi:arginine 2-monooxygenase [Streptomyces sp. NPDC058611]|uniref:arginine 2-monooxygenase n=1 Tax=unclassified Streptomyces TaxID=2593676 RepID=UPI0036591452
MEEAQALTAEARRSRPRGRLTGDVLRDARTGVDAGMVVPDAMDTEVRSVRVPREG